MATSAYTGNPNIARQGARARQIAQARNVSDIADPRTYGFMQGLLGSAPDQLGYSVFDDPETKRAAQQAAEVGLVGGGLLQSIPVLGPALKGYGRLAAGQVNRAMMGEGGLLGPITPQPMYVVPPGNGVKPINLSKGIYKPDLTMEEMLKVKDIPTVDRVKQSIDLVGEKEFEKMVNAQYKKYKPSDPDQEAMLVESVTLDVLGRAQRNVGKTGLPSPQSLTMPSVPTVEQMPQSKSLLDMNRTPSEAEIKKAPREDLINWLQNNDPNGTYLDPTPDPAINMYRTAKGYAIEDANTGSVSEFGDYNKAKQEFDALRFSNSEFQPMTLKEAQDSAINYLRESAQPAGGGKLLQFGSKPSGLLD